MTQPIDDKRQAELIEMLDGVDQEPQRYSNFVDTWNTFFEQSGPTSGATFSEVEKAVRVSINSMTDLAPQTHVGRQVAQMLERFGSPAFLVRETGQIVAQNSSALQTYGAENVTTVDDLPLALSMGISVCDAVRDSLDPRRNLQDAVFKRGYLDADDAPVTLSIAPSKPMTGGIGEALVFVVDARWKTEAAGLIKREFDLTEAERELLIAFLDGETTLDMAASRQRSHATVKTQFKSLMTKMGARSQTELFRNALSVSQFVDKVSDIAQVLRHPHRKRVDILRPNGRSVEVTLAGDLKGKPVVFLQNCVAYTFEGHIEDAFHKAGFCLLSICRPGYGETDPAIDDEDPLATAKDDISAVLDQLGHEKCLLLSTNISTAIMYALAKPMHGRIAGLVQVAGAGPLPYFEDLVSSVPWAAGVIRAGDKHPALKVFLIRSGLRAWRAIGQASFMKVQFADDPVELKMVLRTEALRQSQAALEAATQQTYDIAASDTSLAISDFRDIVRSTDLPILVLHGTIDQVFAIEGMRKFARDFASRMTLVELPEAGFSAMATHTSDIVKSLICFAENKF